MQNEVKGLWTISQVEREARVGELFQPVDFDFLLQRPEFRVVGNEFGICYSVGHPA